MQKKVLQNKVTEQNCGIQHKLIQKATNLTRHHGPLTPGWISPCPIGSVPLEPKKKSTRKQNSSNVTYKTNLYKL